MSALPAPLSFVDTENLYTDIELVTEAHYVNFLQLIIGK